MKKQTGLILMVMMMAAAPLCRAHERRTVAEKYNVVVGMVNEPAFNGAMNALDFRVSKGETPVEGLEETLKAEVSHPDSAKPMTLTLRKRHKQPGAYAGYFLPEKPGLYTFRVTGTIEGQPFDETFEAGKVQDAAPLRFPAV